MAAPVPELRECGVVYLDALGIQAATEELESAKELLPVIVEVEERVTDTLGSQGRLEGIRWQLFSDSICLSSLDCKPLSLQALTMTVAAVQIEFAKRGLFMRGAMTLGHHYQGGNVAFGPALSRAVRLESGRAREPRVILDRLSSEAVKKFANMHEQIAPIARDEDGETYFVDFLSVASPEERDAVARELESKHTNEVEKARSRGDGPDMNVVLKLRWLARYLEWSTKRQIPGVAPGFAIVTSTRDWGEDVAAEVRLG